MIYKMGLKASVNDIELGVGVGHSEMLGNYKMSYGELQYDDEDHKK